MKKYIWVIQEEWQGLAQDPEPMKSEREAIRIFIKRVNAAYGGGCKTYDEAHTRQSEQYAGKIIFRLFQIEIPEDKALRRDIVQVCSYLHEEERHFRESGKPKNHIWRVVNRLYKRVERGTI